jgi:hypothetical protein
METIKKYVLDNSRSSEQQRGKGEHRTDTTPKPEISKKQREQQREQQAEKAKPNNSVVKSEQATEPVRAFLFIEKICNNFHLPN